MQRDEALGQGRLLLSGFVEIGLNNGAAFKPISITPDIWYGVTDEITAGLVHSGTGLSGFLGSQGDALCLTGTDNGCAKFYDGPVGVLGGSEDVGDVHGYGGRCGGGRKC